jgi:hypothetical protein
VPIVNVEDREAAELVVETGIREEFSTATRLRHVSQRNSHNRRNRIAVAGLTVLFPRVGRSGNPGLEGVTALRLKKLLHRLASHGLRHGPIEIR